MENKPKSGLWVFAHRALPLNSRMACKAMLPSPAPGREIYKGLPIPLINTNTSSPLPKRSEQRPSLSTYWEQQAASLCNCLWVTQQEGPLSRATRRAPSFPAGWGLWDSSPGTDFPITASDCNPCAFHGPVPAARRAPHDLLWHQISQTWQPIRQPLPHSRVASSGAWACI